MVVLRHLAAYLASHQEFAFLSSGVAAMLECTTSMTTWSQASVLWKFSQTVTGQVTVAPDGPFHVQQFSWVDAFCFLPAAFRSWCHFLQQRQRSMHAQVRPLMPSFWVALWVGYWKTYSDMVVHWHLRRPWNFAKTWSWTSSTFVLQNPLATGLGGDWNSQAVLNSKQHEPSWCGNKTLASSKTALADVNFGHI